MNRRLKIPLAVAVVLIILAAAIGSFGFWSGNETGGLVIHGNVDIRQVDLGFRVGGRVRAIAVDEGHRVTAGALLASLDPQPLAEALAEAQGQADSARAQFAKLRDGNRPQDIAQAVERLNAADAALSRAKDDLDRRVTLVKSGAVSQAVFDATSAQFHAAQADAAAARQALSEMREGFRAEDISAAAAQARQAEARRDRMRTDLADADLRAPDAGVILTRALEPGTIVAPGQTVLTETIDRPVRIRAWIAEPDLARVSPGMAVTVTTDGTAKTYHGTIGYIAPTAEFTPKTVQTEELRTDLVYRLRIIITDPDDALRQGAPVTVTVPGARPKRKA